MNLSLTQQSYGKSSVKLSRVTRDGDQHYFVQLTADVLLDGDFEAAYARGDNANVVPPRYDEEHRLCDGEDPWRYRY